jgi:hypothetical protein
MALVCMALLFTTQERLLAFEDTPLLSARDIVELLAYYLPRRNSTAEEIEQRIRRRHRRVGREVSFTKPEPLPPKAEPADRLREESSAIRARESASGKFAERRKSAGQEMTHSSREIMPGF